MLPTTGNCYYSLCFLHNRLIAQKYGTRQSERDAAAVPPSDSEHIAAAVQTERAAQQEVRNRPANTVSKGYPRSRAAAAEDGHSELATDHRCRACSLTLLLSALPGSWATNPQKFTGSRSGRSRGKAGRPGAYWARSFLSMLPIWPTVGCYPAACLTPPTQRCAHICTRRHDRRTASPVACGAACNRTTRQAFLAQRNCTTASARRLPSPTRRQMVCLDSGPFLALRDPA